MIQTPHKNTRPKYHQDWKIKMFPTIRILIYGIVDRTWAVLFLQTPFHESTCKVDDVLSKLLTFPINQLFWSFFVHYSFLYLQETVLIPSSPVIVNQPGLTIDILRPFSLSLEVQSKSFCQGHFHFHFCSPIEISLTSILLCYFVLLPAVFFSSSRIHSLEFA